MQMYRRSPAETVRGNRISTAVAADAPIDRPGRDGRWNPAALPRAWALPAAVFMMAAVALFYRLGAQSLVDWDEAIYARISQEIVETGEWLTLHFEGIPYLRKPPLFMWTTAALYSVFGVSEFWARAASPFSGLGVVLLTFLIGRRVYGTAVGLIAGAVLLTSYQFLSSARFGTTDVMLTLFFLLALYAYLRVQQGEERAWLLVWLACALAFMVKSAAGLLAPLAIFTAALLDRRVRSALRSRFFWAGMAVAGVIVVPWHLLMLWQHNVGFVEQYFGHSIIDRATGVIDGHEGGRLYYVQRLYWYFYPWVLLAPFSLVLVIRQVLHGSSRPRLLLIAGLLVFGLFTIAETKLRWYIVPLYPILAMFVAHLLWRSFRSWKSFAFSSLLFGFGALVLTAPALMALVLLGCAALLMPVFLWRTRLAATGLSLTFAGVAAIGLTDLYGGTESSIARLARLAGHELRGSEQRLIVYHGLYRPTALFYSRHPIDVVYRNDRLDPRLAPGEERHILIYRRDFEELAGDFDFNVIARDGELVYATVMRSPDANALNDR
jgi:4-amino-4-deoxy-L-arabinose transferase-like glycosyltransferase